MRRIGTRPHLLAAILFGGAAAAQTVAITDGSLGPAVTVPIAASPTGPEALIASGLGRRSGENLFHSFARLDVGGDAAAVFGLPDGATRVISRVTGGRASLLDGRVAFRSETGGGATTGAFWLINPSGVELGAGLDMRTGGAIHIGAADAVVLGDGSRFSAREGGMMVTAAPPEAFGFLGPRPGAVTLSGATLQPGGDLTLAGGAVRITGGRIADQFGGEIRLVGAAPGETVAAAGVEAAEGPPAGGEIALDGGAVVESAAGVATGAVTLRAGSVRIAGDARLTTVSSLNPGAPIRVTARSLTLSDGGALVTQAPSGLLLDRPAGAIVVAADEIALRAGGRIISQTLGAGAGGDVTVSGFDSLVIDRAGGAAETAIESEVGVGATGDAGTVRVAGGALTLLDAGRINATTFGAGDAGDVFVSAVTLTARDGGQVAGLARDPDAPATVGFATGAGGGVEVRASDGVLLDGVRRDSPGPEPEPSGFFVGSEGRFTGRGGALFVQTPRLTLGTEAEIGAEAFGDAAAGSVTIEAGALVAGGGAEIVTTARGAGPAGPIRVTLGGGLTLSDGAQIASRATAPGGRAGAIDIVASTATIADGAFVSTDSAETDGGSVTLGVSGLTLLSRGSITTSVAASDGDGGSVALRGGTLALRAGSRVQANARAGDGGLVQVENDVVVRDAQAVVEADSQTGQPGEVIFTRADGARPPETRPPSVDFFDAFAFVEDPCAVAVGARAALIREGPAGAPFTGAAQPALFGDVIPLPGSPDAAPRVGTVLEAAPCGAVR